MLRRDLRNLSQLVTPLVLGVVYALMVLRSGGLASAEQGNGPAWLAEGMRNAAAYARIGVSLSVGWTLLARLAAMGFSQEGKNYWLLKVAPVSSGQLLAAKFLAAYLPALLLGWAFVGALALAQCGGPDLSSLWFSLAVVGLCLAAMAGIYLAFGVSAARMDWEDPRQMVSGVAGCLGALATGLATVVGLALFAVPQIGLALLGWPTLAGQVLGLLVGGAFSLACALVLPWWVRGRVARLGEG